MILIKGLILAGGYGTRLNPLTKTLSKHLLPVYDKPMIWYPLSTLMLAGIRDILIISTRRHTWQYEELLGNGRDLGIHLSYREQEKPGGLPEAFIIGEEFIGRDSVALALGDNIFHAEDLTDLLHTAKDAVETWGDAVIFAYQVSDPERYGVIDFTADGYVRNIVEKPTTFISNWAVPGLYFYPSNVVSLAKSLKPSVRGELEITDLNLLFASQERLWAMQMSRGTAWLDMGTHEALLEASEYVHTIQKRTGLKIGDIYEVAERMGYINSRTD